MFRGNLILLLQQTSVFLLTLTLLLLSNVFVQAQGYGDRTGNGGEYKNHAIQGRINFPSNQPGTALKVRLESPSSATLTTFSNSEGIFYFNGLYPGQYTVIVEADGQYESAQESLSIDTDSNRNMSQTYSMVIDLREKGSVRTKANVINASLARVPKSALDQFTKAIEAINKGDAKLATDKLNEAIKLYPQFAEAYSELGSLYLKNGNLSKAEETLRKSLQLNEKNALAQLNLGIVLLNQRKMYESEKELEKAVLADETMPIPHMYLGIALLGLNYPDYAEKEFLKAVSLNGSEKVAMAHRYLGGIYWKKENYKQAIIELENYLRLSPKASDSEKVRATIKQLQEKIK